MRPVVERIDLTAIESLKTELDTHWTPDPWRWEDPPSASNHRLSFAPLVVPLVGKDAITVPLLDSSSQLGFHEAVVKVLRETPLRLSDSVFGYRCDPSGRVQHYRVELAQREARNSLHQSTHRFVVRTDIAKYFRSIHVPHLESLIGSSPEGHRVAEYLRQFDDQLGYCLPEGYAASRALANYVLRSVDAVVESDFAFTRWVDDYCVFADTEGDATRARDLISTAVSELGLELSAAKTATLPSSRTSTSAVSVVSHECEDEDHEGLVRRTLESLSSNETSRSEKLLRFTLRNELTSVDTSLLHALASGRYNVPPSAVPRLAWTMAARSDDATTLAICQHLLERADPKLFPWTAMRLSAALWPISRGEVSTRLLSTIEKISYTHPVTRPWMLRVLARHRPERAAELIPSPFVPEREERLVRAELEGAELAAPPVESFL